MLGGEKKATLQWHGHKGQSYEVKRMLGFFFLHYFHVGYQRYKVAGEGST